MVSEQELQEHAGRQLAKFKVPGRIWFHNEPRCPLAPPGKCRKRNSRRFTRTS